MLNAVGVTFLVLIILNYSLEITLTLLNLRHVKEKAGDLPSVFRDRIDSGTYEKSIGYNLESGKFELVEMAVSFLLVIFFVYWGGFELVDRAARGVRPEGYYVPALVFGVTFFLIKFLVNLPFNLYQTFIIEQRYGFNKTTLRLYVSDLVKSLTLSALIGIPIYLGIMWFMASAGCYWWIWCWCFIEAIQIILLVVYPVWIAPLFNKFEPLEEGGLRKEIRVLSKRVGFPSQGVFVMDGSKRSLHSNAYFAGLGRKKRIVLFDTLLKQMNAPQIIAVLAHEFGHYKLGHIKKLLVLNSISSLVGLYLLSELFRLEIFYHGFGFSHPSNYAALIIFSLGASALSFLFTPLFSMLSRKFEYNADAFAINILEKPKVMAEVIALLTKENLLNVNPHPWYSFFHYSHPAPVERVRAIEKAIVDRVPEGETRASLRRD